MPKSDNQEREQRILDTAADLFSHYGYDKTAVSDIARGAGVSQGAIYLHFASKGDLLEGLILREMQTFAEKWLALVEADPQGGTIAGLYKNMLYALNDRAFMSAMFRQDGHVLGSYLRKPDNVFRSMTDAQEQPTRYQFVKLMQDAGAVRQDVDPAVTAHIMDMLAYGLVSMEDVKPKETIPPIEHLIEGIADFMDRALTPEGGGDSEIGKAIIRQLADASRQQFEQMRHQQRE